MASLLADEAHDLAAERNAYVGRTVLRQLEQALSRRDTPVPVPVPLPLRRGAAGPAECS
jgi:hypothetical protein